MTTFTLENITKTILENTNLSEASAIEIANFIVEDDVVMLEEVFFKRVYDKEKQELIINLNIDAIVQKFKEFNTIQFIDFIQDKKNKFNINKIMKKDSDYILYRM